MRLFKSLLLLGLVISVFASVSAHEIKADNVKEIDNSVLIAGVETGNDMLTVGIPCPMPPCDGRIEIVYMHWFEVSYGPGLCFRTYVIVFECRGENEFPPELYWCNFTIQVEC
ncbi:MAG: hypothetical protein HY606_13695 [Planctomycetes bacterium]|nr:hypothetical protein [Planctomycetota bacterium]